MIYGKRLKDLREEKGLKQYEIAELLNFHKNGYGQFERETTLLPIKHLNTLCNYFGVSLDYIFDFTSKIKYSNAKADIDLNIVKNRLKEFRKENNLSQEKLASILNVAKGTIGNYESSRSLIATPFLYTICKKYNISADYLLGKTENPKYLTK